MVAFPVTESVAVVSDVRVTTVVRPAGTFDAVWVIVSPFDPANIVVPGLLKVMVAVSVNEPTLATSSVKFRVLQVKFAAGVSVVVVSPVQAGPS